ncbi:putative serine/threonine-protein kinase [Gracilariopsis chorda]|uniref:Putative serine/threonine-protein kinase n=1 Tax=Gracilariopsis chorda TaxID=448386 RepID=A0A2V3IT52_9FLOR|nr:putative serine/threonine-protein kinase [Gracilariopsis chorda]|eukprot:PXF45308.1 putative serine/threonine-protein kinase [Gracilariopsis chorda]
MASPPPSPARRPRIRQHHPLSLTTPGITPSQVEVSASELGSGSFGTVYKGTFCGCPVAVKQSKLPTNSRTPAYIQFRREMSRYKRLRHPCITQFFGVLHHPQTNNLLLIVELMRGGTLFTALQKLRQTGHTFIPHESLLRIAQNITNALTYLHASHFSFGDLKTMNILLSEKPDLKTATFAPTAHAKLCDFGLSRNLNHLTNRAAASSRILHETHIPAHNGPAGTYAYLAPESFHGLPIDDPDAPKAADVYALAIVLWELATLQKPWPHLQPLQLIHLVAKQRQRPQWTPSSSTLPPGYVHLVEQCWHHDPACRPTAGEVASRLHHMYQRLPTASHPSQRALLRDYSHVEPISESVTDPTAQNGLDDLSEFDAIFVDDDEVREDSSRNQHAQRHVRPVKIDEHLATIKHVQSVRLSPEELLSICDNMSHVTSDTTHAPPLQRTRTSRPSSRQSSDSDITSSSGRPHISNQHDAHQPNLPHYQFHQHGNNFYNSYQGIRAGAADSDSSRHHSPRRSLNNYHHTAQHSSCETSFESCIAASCHDARTNQTDPQTVENNITLQNRDTNTPKLRPYAEEPRAFVTSTKRYSLPPNSALDNNIENELELFDHDNLPSVEQLGISLQKRTLDSFC